MENEMVSPTPQSEYFKNKHDVALDKNEIIVFSCLKNEEKRIPYFLEYYRSLGVKNFFIIDNDSVDNSAELLKSEPDVHYFHTSMSYRGSSAGRLWLQELAEHYGKGRWCLTVDVDELLVYPGVEYCDLSSLCTYLDIEDSQGLFCIFLDLYSDRPLGETIYTPGEPFTDICNNFDADSYIIRPGMLPPNLGVFGGPRGESFLEDDRQGPMMKKVPLVKYQEGFSYIYSTHSHKHIRLSKLTGSVLHFKFFEFFTDLAKYEEKRGDRRQQKDYAHYANKLNDMTCFFSSASYRYSESADLVRLGIMAINRDFRDYCRSLYGEKNPGMMRLVQKALPRAAKAPPLHTSGAPTIRWINAIWPFSNNRGAINHLSDGIVGLEFSNRNRFLRNFRRSVKLIDIRGKVLRLSIPEDLAYRYNRPNLSLLMLAQGRLVFAKSLDFESGSMSVDEGSLVPAIYTLDISDQDLGNEPDILFDVKLYLVGDEQLSKILDRMPATKKIHPEINDQAFGEPIKELFFFAPQGANEMLPQTFTSSLPSPPVADGETSSIEPEHSSLALDGVIERVTDGEIGGWVRATRSDPDGQEHSLMKEVSIYINDRYCGSTFADIPSKEEEGNFFRFKFKLPLGYFYEREEWSIKVECIIARHDFVLRRSPVNMYNGTSYKYKIDSKNWVEYEKVEVIKKIEMSEPAEVTEPDISEKANVIGLYPTDN